MLTWAPIHTHAHLYIYIYIHPAKYERAPVESATTLKTAPLAHLEAGQYKNNLSFTGAFWKKKISK